MASIQTMSHSISLLRRAALACASLALVSSSPSASNGGGGGDLDLSVKALHVTQSVQNNVNSIGLVGDRSTATRVAMSVSGSLPPGTQVDALLRIYIGGVEAPNSPVYSDNGPLEPPAAPNPNFEDDALNFSFRVPVANDVVLEAELNPAGPNQVFETDYSNNKGATSALTFACKRVNELVYVPIDYRPGGGPTPNLPNPLLIEPGVGDNFIQGIYPTADWEYRRSDAPSKLWTSSLSGTGSSLLSSLKSDLLMTVPQPDWIYGWVPGSLPYNGQAEGIPGKAGMGNTQPIRHQRTFAHEIGHLTGLFHISQNIQVVGIDVERHLAITESLPYVKSAGLSDIMNPGLLTNQAWTWTSNQNFFFNHSSFQCTGPLTDDGPSSAPRLLLAGVWDHSDNSFELTDSVVFEGGQASETVPLASADLVLRSWSGGRIALESGFRVNTPTDSCSTHCAEDDCEDVEHADSSAVVDPIAAFSVVLPSALDPSSVDRISVVDPISGRELAELVRTPNAPVVSITAPVAGALLADQVLVQWQASDADGDALSFYLRYSPNGERVIPIASQLTGREYMLDLGSLPGLTAGAGYLELLATDGLNTTVARVGRADAGLSQDGGGNAPTTHILTPDDGTQYLKGATVLLHSSGWDLEDRGLTGASIVWTSDVDGQIATGRVPTVADLSVGNHVLTVTATDSQGMTGSDTASITVVDRALPGELCQTDLGFGGPGSSSLEVCGGDLSSGTSGEIRLSGAAPNTSAFVLIGFTNAPTALLGGTLVPLPATLVVPGGTDGNGDWLVASFGGGGGPLSVYVQAIYIDALQVQGWGVSNAVQVDFLP